jgi:pyruvate kinase
MISKTLSAKVIVTATFSGLTANRVACHRPNIPIMAIVSDPVIARRLSLCWGIESVLTDPIQSTSQLVRVALSKSVELYGAKPGDIITITAGTPYNQKGTTNLIKVERVPASFAEES